MQKKDPKYSDLKEETAWTMEQFKYIQIFHFIFDFFPFFSDYINKYLSSNKNLEKDWVLNVLPVSLF